MNMTKRYQPIIAGFIVLLLTVIGKPGQAQNATDFRFSEVLVYNDSNYVDDFGHRSGWLEIVNSSYSNLNIGGCYLSDDANNPTKYWIPNDSPETLVPARSFVVFFADDEPTRGIFHLNFTLEEGKTIYLYDANGRTKIDELTIPGGFKPNYSLASLSVDNREWKFTNHTTPGSNNDHSRKVTAGEKFVEHDPIGIGMVVIAMSVVFLALALLFIVYRLIGNFFHQKTLQTKVTGEELKKGEAVEISGEVNAAIAMALYLYQAEMHDEETTVLTIKKVARSYSPWSSKIYTLRKNPRL